MQDVEAAPCLLRPMVPSATYCWLGVITWNMPLMPVIIAVMSVELMLPVRSATTATSMGLSGIVPHGALAGHRGHRTGRALMMPIAGAKEKGTGLVPVT